MGLIERAGYESVRVVIHLRRQDERASASYINRIQQAKLKPFDVAAHLEAARAYDYDELIRRWETHPLVEEVTVRLYPGQAGGASPTIMLLEELGLDVSDLHAGDLVDPTPEVDAVAAEFVRRLGLAAEVHGTDAQARSIRVALSVLAGRSDGLSIPASDAVKIMTAFAESNALALARVDGGDEAYFEPKAGPDPPPLDPQSVLELTGELWRYALDRIP